MVKTLGFNTTITLVLTCPPFLFAGAAGVLFGYTSGRFHERTWHITVGLATAIVGFVIAASTLNTAGRYVACFIFPIGAYSVNSVIIGWASSTLSQTREKQAVSLAPLNQNQTSSYPKAIQRLTGFPINIGCPCHDKRWGPDRVHIRSVCLAQLRLAQVRHRLWHLCWLCPLLDPLCLVDEISPEKGEQTAAGDWYIHQPVWVLTGSKKRAHLT